MKIAAKLTFASALVLMAMAPSFSHAAYFVDQTKTWAIGANAQDVMAKGSAAREIQRRGLHALAMVPKSGLASSPGNVAATGGGSVGYNESLSHSNNY